MRALHPPLTFADRHEGYGVAEWVVPQLPTPASRGCAAKHPARPALSSTRTAAVTTIGFMGAYAPVALTLVVKIID